MIPPRTRSTGIPSTAQTYTTSPSSDKSATSTSPTSTPAASRRDQSSSRPAMARNFALESVLLFPRRRSNTPATVGAFGLIAAGVGAGLFYQDAKGADAAASAAPDDATRTKSDTHAAFTLGLLNANFGTGCTHSEFSALLKWREENQKSGK